MNEKIKRFEKDICEKKVMNIDLHVIRKCYRNFVKDLKKQISI